MRLPIKKSQKRHIRTSKTGMVFGAGKNENIKIPEKFLDLSNDKQKNNGTLVVKAPNGSIYSLHKNGYINKMFQQIAKIKGKKNQLKFLQDISKNKK